MAMSVSRLARWRQAGNSLYCQAGNRRNRILLVLVLVLVLDSSKGFEDEDEKEDEDETGKQAFPARH